MWKFDHCIPATDVDVEEQRLAEVLAGAGYDVGKLSLNGLAQQVLAERAKAVVMAIGIEPSNWPHYALGNGGVEQWRHAVSLHRIRISNHRNNGVPSKAVTTPSGMTRPSGARRVRRSAPVSSTAPSKAAGSNARPG